MTAHSTKAFKSGNSVAVRLPKDFGISAGTELELVQEGGDLTIRRKRMTNQELVKKLREIGPPPGPKLKRERIIFPKRPGL